MPSLDTSHLKPGKTLVELIFIEHEIIIGVPEADVHNPFRNLDFALFKPLAKSISALTNEEFLDFGIFLLSKPLSKFNTNLSVENAINVLRPEMNFFQLRDRPVAPGEVLRGVFAAKFFLLDELADFVLVLREKVSIVVVRILAVVPIFVMLINSRNKRTVVILSDVLLTAVDYQFAEIREREDLAAHHGVLNVAFIDRLQ